MAVTEYVGKGHLTSVGLPGPSTSGAVAGNWVPFVATEQFTLSAGGATTDSTSGLLPADSIIETVIVKITTGITGAGAQIESIGDGSTAARFRGSLTDTALGTIRTCITHLSGANVYAGQQAAASVRITSGAACTTGAVLVTVYGKKYVAAE